MRFQLALNVRDLDEAVAYYSRLFGVPVNKRKPGYANFAVENPPLKLVLFEAPDAPERLNHVGFEYFDDAAVEGVAAELEPRGLAERIERDETCCYAKKRAVWASDPQGLRWEFYRVDANLSEFAGGAVEEAPAAATAPTPATSASSAVACGCASPAR
ncbi:MAG TPA: ArsI/CadI family heavy metal resistance metalloenzyme [Myxococcota bacterium]|nr:ArsI/CadI family heavy metal resistance metalloenzyme [Myxococcota bacterium]